MVCKIVLVAVVFAAMCAGFSAARAASVSDEEFRRQLALPHEPHSLLNEILARDEFAERPPSLIAQLRQFAREALIRIVKWVLQHLPQLGPLDLDEDVGQFLLDAQLIGVVAIAGAFVAWVLMRFLSRRRARVRMILQAPEHVESDVRGSSEAYSTALKMADKGNYRDGLVYLFRYVLLWLDENGRFSIGPGKTNREVLRSIPPSEPIRAAVAEMIPLFNGVRFGNAPCDRADYEHFQDLCRRVTDRT